MNKHFSPTESILVLFFNMIFLFSAFSFRDYSFIIIFFALIIYITYFSIKMKLNTSFRKTRSTSFFMAILICMLVYVGYNVFY
ncbi:hypothetical protein DFR59_102270 [Falsibacillus pallidus]|uniref:Uncharacterized protein n=1 Tax=Falsibacillus pallidus TaxID=493781 RepID=A0A370GQG1_9BACI|nr:hypothetical protein DFR59_102270 [Falsibacillus pallidus]